MMRAGVDRVVSGQKVVSFLNDTLAVRSNSNSPSGGLQGPDDRIELSSEYGLVLSWQGATDPCRTSSSDRPGTGAAPAVLWASA